MSCNGCRILRKGCNDNCILRQSLMAIDTPQAQANATLFVAKFFGRAGLISFLSSVPQSQRPALFQSLLLEACGRTVNPVNGAVGLLTTGNWHVCHSAMETVLRGGVLQPLPEISKPNKINDRDFNTILKRKEFDIDQEMTTQLDLGLAAGRKWRSGKRRLSSPPSDQSETTTLDSGFLCHQNSHEQNCEGHETKLLPLFF